jgi:hypothetical protein
MADMLNDEEINEFSEMTNNLSEISKTSQSSSNGEVTQESQEVATNDSSETKESQPTIEEVVSKFLETTKVNLLIATNAPDGYLSTGYNQGIIGVASHFTKLNIPFEIAVVKNETDYSTFKNGMVALALCKSYTHLLFIDRDVTFSWDSVLSLLLKNNDITGGLAPKSNIDWNRLINAYIVEVSKQKKKEKENEEQNTDDKTPSPDLDINYLLAKTYNYGLDAYVDENQKPVVENNCIRASTLSTDFVMFKCSAFEKIIEKFPTLRYQNTNQDYNSDPNIKDYFYTFFESKKDLTTNVCSTADQTFFQRWAETEGVAWIDLNVNLNRLANMDFRGSFLLSVQD